MTSKQIAIAFIIAMIGIIGAVATFYSVGPVAGPREMSRLVEPRYSADR
ncbi:hypothetical protein [Mycoplana sp. MJR14]|nr:hypothetical protein [Mycoplana sp. MJR14]MDF1631393.1 hypothetical protein [Mycoplana sp. MJR14]